jgi:hypothetical protein
VTGIDEACWIEHYRRLEGRFTTSSITGLGFDGEQDIGAGGVPALLARAQPIRADTQSARVSDGAQSRVESSASQTVVAFVSFESLPEDSLTGAAPGVWSRALTSGRVVPEALKRVLLLSEVAGMSYRESPRSRASGRNRRLAVLARSRLRRKSSRRRKTK